MYDAINAACTGSAVAENQSGNVAISAVVEEHDVPDLGVRSIPGAKAKETMNGWETYEVAKTKKLGMIEKCKYFFCGGARVFVRCCFSFFGAENI